MLLLLIKHICSVGVAVRKKYMENSIPNRAPLDKKSDGMDSLEHLPWKNYSHCQIAGFKIWCFIKQIANFPIVFPFLHNEHLGNDSSILSQSSDCKEKEEEKEGIEFL